VGSTTLLLRFTVSRMMSVIVYVLPRLVMPACMWYFCSATRTVSLIIRFACKHGGPNTARHYDNL
jgi:hypothetical protein